MRGQKNIFLTIFLLLSSPAWAASLKEDHFEGQMVLQKEHQEISFSVAPDSILSLKLFYFKNEEKVGEESFIEIKPTDIHSLTLVDSPVEPGNDSLIASVIITDEGGIFMGYIQAQESFFKGALHDLGKLNHLKEVIFLTSEEDVKDSLNYALEYNKEFLWKGVEAGDFVKYSVTENELKFDVLQQVVKINEDSVELEIKFLSNDEVIHKIFSFKEYPIFKVKKVHPRKSMTLTPMVRDLAEKKEINSQTFQIEVEGEDENSSYIVSLDPSLFPLAFSKGGVNGVIQDVVEVNRLRVDPEKEKLEQLSEAERNELEKGVKTYAADLFLKLQEQKLDASMVDRYIAMRDLFISIQGDFPQSFEEAKTVEQKIKEMEQMIDEHFNSVDKELEILLEELNHVKPEDKTELEEKIAMLNHLKETNREEVKRKKRAAYEASFQEEEEQNIRRTVVVEKIRILFQNKIPSGMSVDELMNLGHFSLISPTRAVISFPKSSIKIHLKLYDGQWKVIAIVD